MNWHAKSDRLYEEAALSPEAFDRLLNRLQRTRTNILTTNWVLALVLAAFGVWLLIRLKLFLTDPTQPAPAWLDPAKYLAMPLVTSILFVVTTQLIGLSHTDACIKMLLLVRGKANATAKEEQTRNA